MSGSVRRKVALLFSMHTVWQLPCTEVRREASGWPDLRRPAGWTISWEARKWRLILRRVSTPSGHLNPIATVGRRLPLGHRLLIWKDSLQFFDFIQWPIFVFIFEFKKIQIFFEIYRVILKEGVGPQHICPWHVRGCQVSASGPLDIFWVERALLAMFVPVSRGEPAVEGLRK